MGILDTFYILFKNNSSEVVKQNQQIENSSKKTADSLKNTNDQAEKLGESYVKIAESLGSMITAYLSLDAVKGGLQHAQQFTAGLEMQSRWLQQNSSDLAAYGNAVKTVGGSSEAFVGTIKKLHDTYAAQGFASAFPDIINNIANLADEWDRLGLSRNAKETIGLRLGLDEGTILLMDKGGDAMRRIAEEQRALLNLAPQDEEAARGIATGWSEVSAAFTGLYNKINTDLYPLLKDFFDAVKGFAVWMQGHPRIAEGLVLAITALGSVVAGGVIAGSITAIGAAAAVAAPLFWVLAGALTAAAIAYGFLSGKDTSELQQGRPAAGSPSGSSPLGIRNNNPGNLRPGGQFSSYATPEAGLGGMANNLRRYGRNGWNTVGSIISHWAPPNENNTSAYIAAISRATGFAPNQPLDLNDPATLQKLMGAITQHENGMNPYSDQQVMQGIMMGKQAIGDANASPFNSVGSGAFGTGTISGGTSVKTGDIHVHTQATDANGISRDIASTLKTHLRNLVSNMDDGILA